MPSSRKLLQVEAGRRDSNSSSKHSVSRQRPSGRTVSWRYISRRHLPRQSASGQDASQHLPSGHSLGLTDAEYQGKGLLNALCHGDAYPDDTRYGEARPDRVCHGICHLDAVWVLRTQRVKGIVFRTQCITVEHVQAGYIPAFAIWLQHVRYAAKLRHDLANHGGFG